MAKSPRRPALHLLSELTELTLRSGRGERGLDVVLEHRARDHRTEPFRERQQAIPDPHERLPHVVVGDDARAPPEAAVGFGRPHDRETVTTVGRHGVRTVPGATAAHLGVDRRGAGLARRRAAGLDGRRHRTGLRQHCWELHFVTHANCSRVTDANYLHLYSVSSTCELFAFTYRLFPFILASHSHL